MEDIIVTTGDLKQEYEVIGPVYFQTNNKGLLGSSFGKLQKKYREELDSLKQKNQVNSIRQRDWGAWYGEFSFGMANDFDKAFFIAVMELRKRAKALGADAIICMRQDLDLDTEHFQAFYLQMYGTAVKFIKIDNNRI